MIGEQRDKAKDRRHEERICWEIVENVNSIILRWDTDLRVTFINKFAQQFFGYSRDEILGKSLIGTIVPATSAAGRDLTDMIRGIVRHPEQYVNNENENERHDGTRVWISWTNRAIRDRERKVIEIVSVGNDITDRKRAEEALQRQLKMTESLLDAIPVPVFYKNARGVYTGCNRAFADFMGKPKDEIIGRTVYEVAPPDLADIYHRTDEELIHHPGKQVYETSIVTVDGTRHDVIFNKATYLNEDGTTGGIIGTILDITKRKNIERELVKSRESLEMRVRERTMEFEEANRSLRHEIVEHQRDEEALKIRVRFENLIMTLSSRFINLAPEEIDRELYYALKKIGEFAGVDRCYIGITHAKGKILDIAYEWATEGVGQFPEYYHNIVANDVYPWSARIVRNLEVLYIPSVEDLPLEADKDKETLQAQQIKSLVVVPMVYKKSLIGIVGFDSVREKKAWTDDDIALLRIVGEIFTNAIERKRIEEELRESEERFRATFEQAAVGIAHVALDGHYIRVNEKYCDIVGYSCDEMTRRTYLDITYPEDQKADEVLARQLLEGKKSTGSIEKRYISKDGSLIWVTMTVSIARDREGRPEYFIAVIGDITRRKQAEEALRESEEKFRALAESSNAAITIFRDDKNIYVNRAAAEVTGCTIEELMKTGPLETISPGDRAQALESIKMLERGKRTRERLELEILRKDGSTRWIDVSAAPISYHGKNALISIALDITDRKQAEDAMKRAKARAELYLDLMGHDISNMNQAMMGYLEMAQELLDLNGQEELIERPLEIIKHSSRLIANVKKLEQIEAGKYPVKTANLCQVLKEVADTYAVVPGRDVRINLALRAGCCVTANDLLKDVFDNLVDNAIRHSTGPVTVDISTEPVLEDGLKYYMVSVADKGPGIPDDLKRKIFRFIDVATGSPGRRGLGLYMVRTLVESYHGKVWAEDRVPGDYHKGSRFVVLLPAAD